MPSEAALQMEKDRYISNGYYDSDSRGNNTPLMVHWELPQTPQVIFLGGFWLAATLSF